MNIEQAKQIDIRLLAEHFGGRYHKQTKPNEIWYYSPFRPDERTASFKVNPQRNNWYDFARGEGGSTIDLWIDFNNQDRKSRDAIKSALQDLERFSAQPLPVKKLYRNSFKDIGNKNEMHSVKNTRFKLIKVLPRIWHEALLQEVGRRKLSMAAISPYLKQAYLLDTKTGNRLTGFAFQNNANGWEISIPNHHTGKNFKTSIGKKSPTSFTDDKHEQALIFEDFWDYLTWIQTQKKSYLKADIYVLNSLSFKKQVTDNIIATERIKKVLLFLDNDEAGEDATCQIVEWLESNRVVIVGDMRDGYKKYKDLSEFHSRPL